MRKLLTLLLILSLLCAPIHARISLDLNPIDTDLQRRHLEQRTVVSVAERSSTHGRTQSSLYKENKERPKVLPFSLDPHARELTLPAQDDAETLTTLQKFSDRLMRRGIEAGVSTSVHAAVTGRSDLGQVGRGLAAALVADSLAGEVGGLKKLGAVDPVTHKLLHGLAGGTVGFIAEGEKGILPGAAGAMVAETVAETLAPDKPKDPLSESEVEEYETARQRAGLTAKFVAPLTVMLAGGSASGVGTSIMTSSAAIENNFFMTGLDLEELSREDAEYLEQQRQEAEMLKDLYDRYGDIALDVAECLPLAGTGITIARQGFDIATGKTTVGAALLETGTSFIPYGKAAKLAAKGLKSTTKAVKFAGKEASASGTHALTKQATAVKGGASTSAARPAASSSGKTSIESLDLSQPKIHKNSLKYKGETHIYEIRDVETGRVHKIGESARGTRKRDGASIRAEEQARRLNRETNGTYETKIRHVTESKMDGRSYETKFIERYRRMFGKDLLPGNKTNR